MVILAVLGSSILGHLNAFEEDPRIEEHNKRTMQLIKLGDKQAREAELKFEETTHEKTNLDDDPDDDDDGT